MEKTAITTAQHEDRTDVALLGLRAAERCLEHMGRSIIARDWSCKYGHFDFVCLDDATGDCSFITVVSRKGIELGVPEDSKAPAELMDFERAAMTFMIDHDIEGDTVVQFDKVAVCIMSDRRALVRTHLNVQSKWFAS